MSWPPTPGAECPQAVIAWMYPEMGVPALLLILDRLDPNIRPSQFVH